MGTEKIKMIGKYLKHVTTLASGSIIVIVTFFEKLPTAGGKWKLLLLCALALFVVSIFSGTLAHMAIATTKVETERSYESIIKVLFCSWWAFAVGMMALAGYGAIALFSAHQ
jgi:hypothetical protein